MLSKLQADPETVDSPHTARVCAVIITYGIGAAVHRCFDSVASQVGQILIVDNGSDEITRRELEKLAASDSVTLIVNEPMWTAIRSGCEAKTPRTEKLAAWSTAI